MTSPHSTPRQILVMMLGDVGDLLLATPALRALRATYPAAHITAMTKPSTVSVLVNAGLVDAFLPVEKQLFDRPSALLRPTMTLGLLRYVYNLRRCHFDAVVLLHHLVTVWGTVKFAGLVLGTGAPVRAGLDNGRGFFLTHRARDRGFDAAHESDYWLRVVAALAQPSASGSLTGRGGGLVRGRGRAASAPPPPHEEERHEAARPPQHSPEVVGAARPRGPHHPINHPSPPRGRGVGGEGAPIPIFVVPDAAQAASDALLREAGIAPGTPLLAMHPGSGAYSVARRWFPERFAAVADELAARHGLRVVLVGTADERALTGAVIGQMHAPAVNLAGRTSLDELGGVLRRCALLIGNDAGVAHLAPAVGTPVVAIFGPFNHHTWHPLGRHLVVRAEPALPCMPCVNRGFARGYPEGCPPRYCLQEVTPAMVVAAAEQLLGATP